VEYVKLVHYCFADESKDYSIVYDRNDEKLFETNDEKVISEIDNLLSKLSEKGIITLSIKQKG
jgi:hypothetical protein